MDTNLLQILTLFMFVAVSTYMLFISLSDSHRRRIGLTP
jgi:hypothetical protein